MSSKSVLDDMPIIENAVNRLPPKSSPNYHLEIVGNCPSCGAPIYVSEYIAVNNTDIKVQYSCACRHHKSIQDTMQTK